jgi:hypothetical protein
MPARLQILRRGTVGPLPSRFVPVSFNNPSLRAAAFGLSGC